MTIGKNERRRHRCGHWQTHIKFQIQFFNKIIISQTFQSLLGILRPHFLVKVPDCFVVPFPKSWSSLVEGGEGLYLSNCQTTLVIALDALFLLFFIFINTTAYHLGRYKPSPYSIYDSRVQQKVTLVGHHQSQFSFKRTTVELLQSYHILKAK